MKYRKMIVAFGADKDLIYDGISRLRDRGIPGVHILRQVTTRARGVEEGEDEYLFFSEEDFERAVRNERILTKVSLAGLHWGHLLPERFENDATLVLCGSMDDYLQLREKYRDKVFGIMVFLPLDCRGSSFKDDPDAYVRSGKSMCEEVIFEKTRADTIQVLYKILLRESEGNV